MAELLLIWQTFLMNLTWNRDGRVSVTWQCCGWIWHWERKWLHFRYMTARVILFDMEANMAEFSLTWCRFVVSLTWKRNWLNGNDWISTNMTCCGWIWLESRNSWISDTMTMLWMDLAWKHNGWILIRHDKRFFEIEWRRTWLNSCYYDKHFWWSWHEMAEFLLQDNVEVVFDMKNGIVWNSINMTVLVVGFDTEIKWLILR